MAKKKNTHLYQIGLPQRDSSDTVFCKIRKLAVAVEKFNQMILIDIFRNIRSEGFWPGELTDHDGNTLDGAWAKIIAIWVRPGFILGQDCLAATTKVRLRREAREGVTHTRPLYRTNRCPVLWSLELLLLDAQSDSNACVEEAQGLEVARQGPYGHVL